MKSCLLLTLFSLIVMTAHAVPALAATPAPGGACTTGDTAISSNPAGFMNNLSCKSGFWVQSSLNLKTNTAAPFPCTADVDGAIAFNSHYAFCTCRGSTAMWIQVAIDNLACVW